MALSHAQQQLEHQSHSQAQREQELKDLREQRSQLMEKQQSDQLTATGQINLLVERIQSLTQQLEEERKLSRHQLQIDSAALSNEIVSLQALRYTETARTQELEQQLIFLQSELEQRRETESRIASEFAATQAELLDLRQQNFDLERCIYEQFEAIQERVDKAQAQQLQAESASELEKQQHSRQIADMKATLRALEFHISKCADQCNAEIQEQISTMQKGESELRQQLESSKHDAAVQNEHYQTVLSSAESEMVVLRRVIAELQSQISNKV
jgi:exonuclease SbcC